MQVYCLVMMGILLMEMGATLLVILKEDITVQEVLSLTLIHVWSYVEMDLTSAIISVMMETTGLEMVVTNIVMSKEVGSVREDLTLPETTVPYYQNLL